MQVTTTRFISLCSLGIDEFRFSRSKLSPYSRLQKNAHSSMHFVVGLDGPQLQRHRHNFLLPGAPSASGIGAWPKKKIYRCRSAADWFVLSSGRSSNNHIFGESHAVLVSCLRH